MTSLHDEGLEHAVYGYNGYTAVHTQICLLHQGHIYSMKGCRDVVQYVTAYTVS